MLSLQRIILFFSVLFSIHYSHSQSLDYGPIFIWNRATQTNYDPTKPEDGTTQWNALGTFGFGAYASKPISLRSYLQMNVVYQQKGYKEIAQFVHPQTPGLSQEDQFRNTFNYLSVGLQGNHFLIKGRTIDFSLNLGIEYNYLLGYHIASNMLNPILTTQGEWEKHSLNMMPSASFVFENQFNMQFGFNGSITPLLKTENLIVRDWIWTVRLACSIPTLFEKNT